MPHINHQPEYSSKLLVLLACFFFSSRRRHTRWPRDWSSDVCSSDLVGQLGMLHPELTDGATENEAAEIAGHEQRRGVFSAYASCNRTCEMGMSRATGREDRKSVVEGKSGERGGGGGVIVRILEERGT